MKSREVELGSNSRVDRLAAELFLNSCFSDAAFVTLFHTAAGTAVSRVYKLLCTGEVPASLTLSLWQWLVVSLVFMGQCAWTGYSWVPDSPLSPSLISHTVSVDVKHHDHLLT